MPKTERAARNGRLCFFIFHPSAASPADSVLFGVMSDGCLNTSWARSRWSLSCVACCCSQVSGSAREMFSQQQQQQQQQQEQQRHPGGKEHRNERGQTRRKKKHGNGTERKGTKRDGTGCQTDATPQQQYLYSLRAKRSLPRNGKSPRQRRGCRPLPGAGRTQTYPTLRWIGIMEHVTLGGGAAKAEAVCAA